MTDDNEEKYYILITQCLQNDFFINEECRLCLPNEEANKMLIGIGEIKEDESQKNKKSESMENVDIEQSNYDKGPLGLFLKNLIGGKNDDMKRNETLYVINIRDCHDTDPSYDQERRQYGRHCEKYTDGFGFIAGLEEYLEERDENKKIRIYDVPSDSLFDFRNNQNEFEESKLESILDKILDKRRENNDTKANGSQVPKKVYMLVIGVYTDIKVKILLTTLRAKYKISNLAVSDTLTASVTLERHLGALDFAHKTLDVEVIHGLNDSIKFLGGKGYIHNELKIISPIRFSDYVTYYQEKQRVLGYEITKEQDYIKLANERASEAYEIMKNTYKRLKNLGFGLLIFGPLISLVAVILDAFFDIDWKVPLTATAVTGGLGFAQIVYTFILNPIKHLQRNLSDLTKNITDLDTFKMILYDHSFKSALAHFHLTTPQVFYKNLEDPMDAVEILQKQIEAINKMELQSINSLSKLGFTARDEKIEDSGNNDSKNIDNSQYKKSNK